MQAKKGCLMKKFIVALTIFFSLGQARASFFDRCSLEMRSGTSGSAKKDIDDIYAELHARCKENPAEFFATWKSLADALGDGSLKFSPAVTHAKLFSFLVRLSIISSMYDVCVSEEFLEGVSRPIAAMAVSLIASCDAGDLCLDQLILLNDLFIAFGCANYRNTKYQRIESGPKILHEAWGDNLDIVIKILQEQLAVVIKRLPVGYAVMLPEPTGLTLTRSFCIVPGEQAVLRLRRSNAVLPDGT